MHSRRLIAWIAIVLLVAVAIGIVNFPAMRGFPLIAPANVEAQGLSGTVWRGGAESIRRGDAPPLENVAWRIRPQSLLQLHPAWQVDFTLAGGDGQGRLAVDWEGRIRLSAVEHRAPAERLGPALGLPWLRFAGELHTTVANAWLVNGEWHELDARMVWDPAALDEPVPFPLGAVQGSIRPDATGNGYDIELTARGGMVEIAADGDMDETGRYRVEYRMWPAESAPPEVGYLLEWIARRDGDEFVIRLRGRLAE